MISNLLSVALNTIKRTPVTFEKYLGDIVGYGGIAQPTFEPSVVIYDAIAQPLDNETYEKLGLDFQKEYFKFFLKGDALALEEDNPTPDRIGYDNKIWVIVKVKRWALYDSWTQVIAINQKDYTK